MKLDFKKLPLIFFVSSTLFVILFLIIVGISFWILIFGAIWILFYLIFISQKIKLSFIKHEAAWLFFSILILISIFTIYALQDNNSSSENKVKTLSADECKPIYDNYNNKALDIKGENLVGTVGITINSNDCRANVYYNFMLTDNLSKNYRQENLNYDDYEYVAAISDPSNKDFKFGTTEIFPVFSAPSSFPANIFEFDTTKNGATGWGIEEGKSTNKFYTGWSTSYIFTENSIDKLLARNIFELFDSSGYVTKETTSDSGISYYTNSDKAAKEGPVIKTIELTYSER